VSGEEIRQASATEIRQASAKLRRHFVTGLQNRGFKEIHPETQGLCLVPCFCFGSEASVVNARMVVSIVQVLEFMHL
jgi:hypothetical protein